MATDERLIPVATECAFDLAATVGDRPSWCLEPAVTRLWATAAAWPEGPDQSEVFGACQEHRYSLPVQLVAEGLRVL